MDSTNDARKALLERQRKARGIGVVPPVVAPPSSIKKVVPPQGGSGTAPPTKSKPAAPAKFVKTETAAEFVTHRCGHRIGTDHIHNTPCQACVVVHRRTRKFGSTNQPAPARLPDDSRFDIAPFVAGTEMTPPLWAATLTVPGFPPFTGTATGLWPLLRALDRQYRDAKRAADRVLSKDMPPQLGDDKPVNPQKSDGPRWGELFGRPRSDKPAG